MVDPALAALEFVDANLAGQIQLSREVRAALFQHLGGEGKLSPPQRILVERAMLQLRCAVLDAKILDASFSEYDAKTYLAFSNSLTRTMGTLGLQATASQPIGRTMADLRREAQERAA